MSTYKINFFATRSLTLVAAVVATALSGCGFLSENKAIDYRSQAGSKPPSLEVPPDLTSPLLDDRFVIPDAKATTYSTYNRDRGAAPAQSAGSLLAKPDNARVERAGGQRWLVVKTTPDKAWAIAKAFWIESGFVLNRETPEIGIMETDWAENRGKIPLDVVRRTIGRVVDGLYSTSERDKFRTRIETGAEPGTTDIYVTHRGAEEVFSNPDKLSTSWQARATDKELEAEMLSRLMLKFGFGANAPEKTTVTASGSTTASGNAAVASVASAASARAFFDKDKGGALKVNEPFDRAWRRVGLALDNIGFTVEDRDRSKGLFFVRYIDPDAEAKSGTAKGFLDKLAFWRKDDPLSKPQYRLFVAETAGATDVVVQGADGKVENSSTAKRILSLLLEQLK